MAPVPIKVNEGQWTSTIYDLIKNGKHQDAVQILEGQLEQHPLSRAPLSLLGHCYYYLQEFQAAVQWYVLRQ